MGTTTPIGEIARVATSPLWFQLYFQSDQEFTRDVVRQAEQAGCEVLCVTVDTRCSVRATVRRKRGSSCRPG
jgi:4-hydroxymandelate oxidase